MFLLQRLRDEPQFAGSRSAPAGCQIFDTAGTHTFTWPAGVTRVVATCVSGGAGGAAGTSVRGAGAGGGGSFAESLVSKSDATATVTVGVGGAGGSSSGDPGGSGGASKFEQATSGVNVLAAGPTGGNGAAGGTGGSAASSTGTFKYSGGNGGGRDSGDDGGGGGGAAAGYVAGTNGQDGSAGGVGGSAYGGNGGHDGVDGQDGTSFGGGGGGGGTDAFGGDGYRGRVVVCWDDPLPIGYCTDSQCRKWWGFGQTCGPYYGYGRRCFYYGYRYPYGPYLYGSQGWQFPCCNNRILPPRLWLTINNLGFPGNENCYISQTVPLDAVDPAAAGGFPAYRAEVAAGASPYEPAWLFLVDRGLSYCELVCSQAPTWAESFLETFHPMAALSCDPLFLHLSDRVELGVPASDGWCVYCDSDGVNPTHTFEVTE